MKRTKEQLMALAVILECDVVMWSRRDREQMKITEQKLAEVNEELLERMLEDNTNE